MEEPVKDQVALVTGAGRGIGRAIALRLARDGMDVAAADLEGPEDVAAEIRAAGRKAVALACDVTSASDRERMFSRTLSDLGRLDALVNNAGIVRAALPLDVDEAHWDAVMDVNAKACWFCSTAAIRHMKEKKSGRIVSLSSIGGKLASTVPHPVYNVSKAAVIAMTRTLAVAHGPDGIRVNAVCPGMVETDMLKRVDQEFSRVTGRPAAEIRAERAGRSPMGWVSGPEEVADAVSFLIGPDSRYITGVALDVAGGILT